MDFLDFLLYAFAAVVVLAALLRWVVRHETVYEFERGLLYRTGRFRRVIDPGGYWLIPAFTTVRKVDARVRSVSVPGQEVLTADSVGLKVSLAAQFEVVDPERAVNRVQSFEDALYQELQLALRELVGGTTADDLLEQRAELSERLAETTIGKASALGLKLCFVGIKDVMFPGELKKIFAQVVKARKEGQAALERARGESAALRNLANAARLIEDSPALMHLRTLQALGEGSGHTVVFGVPDAAGLAGRRKSAGEPANGDGAANGGGTADGGATKGDGADH